MLVAAGCGGGGNGGPGPDGSEDGNGTHDAGIDAGTDAGRDSGFGDEGGPLECDPGEPGFDGPPVIETTGLAETTDMPEFAITFRAEDCHGIDFVDLELDGSLRLPATDMGGGAWRRYVVLTPGIHTAAVIARDRNGEESRRDIAGSVSYTPTEPVGGPDAPRLKGTLVDTFSGGPVSGVRVLVRDTAGEVATDADGAFMFPTAGEGPFVVSFVADGYGTAQRTGYAAAGQTVNLGEIELLPHDAATTLVTAGAGGVHTNSTGEIEIRIPPGALQRDAEISAARYPRAASLPRALPDSSQWTQALDLQPEGLRFDEPVTVRLENALGFAPGTSVPVGYYNTDRALWEPVENGIVTGDGAWIEFRARHFSPRDCNFPTRSAERSAPCNGQGDSAGTPPGADTSVGDRFGGMNHRMPVGSHWNGSGMQSLEAIFSSAAADPSIDVSKRSVAPATTEGVEPAGVEIDIDFDGSTSSYSAPEGSEGSGSIFLARLKPDEEEDDRQGESDLTGYHAIGMTTTYRYLSEYLEAPAFGRPGGEGTGVMTPEPIEFVTRSLMYRPLVDLRHSPFGAGWSLSVEERLLPETDGTIMRLTGDRQVQTFHRGGCGDAVTLPDISPVFDRFAFGADDQGGLWFVSEDMQALVRLDPATGDTVPVYDGTLYYSLVAVVPHGDGVYVCGHRGAQELFLDQVSVTGEVTNLWSAPLDYDDPVTSTLWLAMAGPRYFTGVIDRDDTIWFPVQEGLVSLREVKGKVFVEFHPLTPMPAIEFMCGEPTGMAFVTAWPDRIVYEPEGHRIAFHISGTRTIRFFDIATRTELQGPSGPMLEGCATAFVRNPNGDYILEIDKEECWGEPIDQYYFYDYDRYYRVNSLVRVSRGGRFHAIRPDTEPRDDVIMRNIMLYPGGGAGMITRDLETDVYSVCRFPAEGVWVEPQDAALLVADGTDYLMTGQDGSVRRFDGEGRIVSRRMKDAAEEVYAYDGEGRLTGYAEGTAVEDGYAIGYGPDGTATSIRSPDGSEVTLEIDANNDLVAVRQPDAAEPVGFTYDENHRLTRRAAGADAVEWTYNDAGSVTEMTTPSGTRQYDAAVGDAGGLIPLGEATSKETDEDLGVWIARYGEDGGIEAIDRPDGSVLTADMMISDIPWLWESCGVERIWSVDGQQSIIEQFDLYNRSIGVMRGPVQLYKVAYHDEPHLAHRREMIQLVNVTYHLDHDDAGRLERLDNGFGRILFSYAGDETLPQTITDDYGDTNISYDSAGRVVGAVDATGGEVLIVRDGAGQPTEIWIHGVLVHAAQYAGGRMSSYTDAAGGTLGLGYRQVAGGSGAYTTVLANVTDQDGRVWQFERPGTGALERVVDPTGADISYAYTPGGRLARVTNAPGSAVDYTYDEIGRLIGGQESGGGPAYTIHYDALDRIVLATAPGVEVSRSYDDEDRFITETTTFAAGGSQTVTWSYNESAFLDGITSSAGHDLSIDFHRGQIEEIQDVATGTRVYEADFDGLGRMNLRRARALSNIYITTDLSSLDDAGLFARFRNVIPVGPDDTERIYTDVTWDARRRIAGLTGEPFGDVTYSYDAKGRLTAVGGASTESYTYDARDRIIQTAADGARTLDDGNRLLATGTHAYSHTPEGWRASAEDLSTGETWRYEYNRLGWLVRASRYATPTAVDPEAVVDLAYDAFGRLVVNDGPSGVIRYLWMGQTLLAETDEQGNLIRRYTPGAKVDEVAVITTPDEEYVALCDHRMSVHRLYDSAGQLAASYRYDAYGRQLEATGPAAHMPRRYAGALYLEDIGLYTMRARFYDPDTGRFLTPARSFRDGLNRYGYARHNPVRFVDPLGDWSVEIAAYDTIGGGVVFGTNPNGSAFLSLRAGVGVGISASFDPNGQAPDYQPCRGLGVSGGIFATAGASIGPLGLGVTSSLGIQDFSDISQGTYGGTSMSAPLGVPTGGASLSAAVGGEVTFTF